ncbi:MAG: DUF6084 family protein [Xanthobacteraceae bacterium]
MVDLDFTVQDVEVERHSTSPLLKFALRVTSQTPDVAVLNVMLSCQIRIEPTRRIYGAPEHDMLSDLFGTPERWGQTLQSFLWTHSSMLIPGFDRECVVKLPVPCSFDFNVAATKYFHGIEDGEIPLNFLFSGSVFYRDASDRLQISQIAWTKESAYRLPIRVWRSMMEHYYPQTAWLCLRSDAFERLYRYKRAKGLPSFETALDELLDAKLASAAP